MKVRLLAASACLLGLAAAVPAHATPYAGDFRYLSSGSLSIRGADGARWLMSVFATQGGQFESRSEQKLYVDLSRCAGSTCVSRGSWSRPLTAAEISVSQAGVVTAETNQPATATLRTVLGGRDLTVTLHASGPGGAAFDGAGTGNEPLGVDPQTEQWSYAAGALDLGGLHCAIGDNHGAIGEIQSVDSVGDDTRDPRSAPPAVLPAGFLTGKRAAGC